MREARVKRADGGPDADTTLSALTPEGIEYTLHPAGLAARAAAFAIDTVIQWTIILTAVILIKSMRAWLGGWFMLLLLFTVDWFYHIFAELVLTQSPGKRLAGIRVTQRDGSPVSFSSSMLRNLLRFADTFLALFQISLLAMCLSRGFRRMGDLIAGTIVVYTAASRFVSPRYGLFTADETAAITPPYPLSVEEKRALIMFARRYALVGPSRADEMVKPWTDALGAAADDYRTMPPSSYALGLAKNWADGRS